MFWADKVASEIIESGKYLPYHVDDMKTPSGRVHVGALRGVVVHDLIHKALKDKGKESVYTYVFEDHDPMDDIPSYLPREKYEKYLGMPLFKIPEPNSEVTTDTRNYARFYAEEFKEAFNAIGCEPEIIWTKDLYTSGKMNGHIKDVLDKANVVRGIYEEMYDKKLPDDWYPFQVYCENCGKVSTTQVTDWDGEKVTYECVVDRVKFTKGCGHHGKISPFADKSKFPGKMPWKIEWPCKWKAIAVTIEGAGKDHMSAGGSHDLASLVCERVINYPIPYPVAYEWILVGGRKMSSSKGVGVSAKEMLEILPPELIRFMLVRIKVNTQINFDPSEKDTIPSLFDDFQKAAEEYASHQDSEKARVFELSKLGDKAYPTVRFSTLAQWVQMPNMEEEIKKANAVEWASYAKIWLERFAPEEEKFEVQKELPKVEFSDQEKNYLKIVSERFGKIQSEVDLGGKLYEWSAESMLEAKGAFGAIYKALLGKDHGPKAASLIKSLNNEFVKKRFEEASK